MEANLKTDIEMNANTAPSSTPSAYSLSRSKLFFQCCFIQFVASGLVVFRSDTSNHLVIEHLLNFNQSHAMLMQF